MNTENPNTEAPKTDETAKSCDEPRTTPKDNEQTVQIRSIVADYATDFIMAGRKDRAHIADLTVALAQCLTDTLAIAVDGQEAVASEGLNRLFEAMRGQMPSSLKKAQISIALMAMIQVAEEMAAREKAAEQPAAAAPMTEAAE